MLLQEVEFELVILDMVIPLRSDDTPAREHGLGLLKEIYEGDGLRIPNHVVFLSEYVDTLDGDQLHDFSKRLVHLIRYSDGADDWAAALRMKLEYIKKRIDRAGVIPAEHDMDIGIITSYPIDELKAVTDLDGQICGEFSRLDELYYYRSDWPKGDGLIRVVACAAPSMGMTSACATAMKLINRWRPRFLVMTGIAAGTDGELSLGDVLVAEQCYDYNSGKIQDNAGRRVFVPSPQQLGLDTEMRAILQKWESQQRSMEKIGRIWDHSGKFIPKLRLGVLATGAAVVQSQEYVDEIKSHSRKVLGLEMEAYGAFQAAFLSSRPKPRILVAKAVCDFADQNKDNTAHSLAAFTSARFVFEFFTTDEDVWEKVPDV
jgi:nucleoside phosphorylase